MPCNFSWIRCSHTTYSCNLSRCSLAWRFVRMRPAIYHVFGPTTGGYEWYPGKVCSPSACSFIHQQLTVPPSLLRVNVAASWCWPRTVCQKLVTITAGAQRAAPRMLNSLRTRLTLPKLIWQHLTKARSQGQSFARLCNQSLVKTKVQGKMWFLLTGSSFHPNRYNFGDGAPRHQE